MRKYLIYTILFLVTSPSIQARVAIPLNDLDPKYQSTKYILMYEGKTIRFLGAMTKKEFKALVKGAESKQQELFVEQNDRIRVVFINDVEIENNKPFHAQMELQWLSENNEVIKSVYLEQTLTIVKKKEGFLFYYYKKITIFGFPIMTGIAILLWFL